MIELLHAELVLAETMARLRQSTPEERTAWRTYHDTCAALLEQLQNPPRRRPPPPPIPTRP